MLLSKHRVFFPSRVTQEIFGGHQGYTICKKICPPSPWTNTSWSLIMSSILDGFLFWIWGSNPYLSPTNVRFVRKRAYVNSILLHSQTQPHASGIPHPAHQALGRVCVSLPHHTAIKGELKKKKWLENLSCDAVLVTWSSKRLIWKRCPRDRI